MSWHRKIHAFAFPVGGSEFCIAQMFVRVAKNGRVNLDGMVRMPYSNRPKRGGSRAIPYKALNPVEVTL